VQVSREPIGQKGTRVTSKITLRAGFSFSCRQCSISVFQGGSSRKTKERGLLDHEEISPKGFGLIARTASEGKTRDELAADLGFLMRIWESIQDKAEP
jgi:ribonuclease G